MISTLINNKTYKEYETELISILKVDNNHYSPYEQLENPIIYNKKLYLVLTGNIIKIFNLLTFEEILKLEFPITPKRIEIIDEEHLLLYQSNNLYCLRIDFQEKIFEFKFYITDIYMFKFLYKRKEILIFLTHGDSKARINLEGKIILYKGKKPDIFFGFFEKKQKNQKNEEESEYDDENDGYKQWGYFNYLSPLNKDKYYIFITGYILSAGDDSYSTEHFWTSIYKIENMEEILNLEIGDYENLKITDNYFYSCSRINYYDEKENEIKSENDIINGKYFYLDDNKFAIFDEANNIFLIDVKKFSKIKIKSKNKISNNIEKICYMEYNGLE